LRIANGAVLRSRSRFDPQLLTFPVVTATLSPSQEVSHGTISASLVSPREVFKAAILSNSFALLVAHNHPSGAQLSPSKEDLETTKQLLKAGKILGITVLDHVIVGGDEIYSIRENHPRIWDDPYSQLS
jgi:DNA repair protein RadC